MRLFSFFLPMASLFLLCLVGVSHTSAQVGKANDIENYKIYRGQYASKDNPYYWKNNPPHAGYWQQDVAYQIRAELDDSLETINGIVTLQYTNNSPFPLDKVYFRLIQNAFQPETDLHHLNLANKTQPKYGHYEAQKLGTVIHKMSLKGFEIETGTDQTIVWVHFKKGQTISPGQTVEFEYTFTTFFDEGSLRRRMKKFTHSGVKHFDAVHWYPRICVYDAKFGWHTDQHLGKEFYGNFGSYDVHITLPSDYIVEATGELQNENEVLPDSLYQKIKIENYALINNGKPPYRYTIPRKGLKTWKYYAVNTHDFAFTCDPSYRIGRTYVGPILCVTLAQEQNAHGWQPTTRFLAEVVRIYSEDFGMYVYPKMVAADARDGMEYPMLTLNSGNWPGHQFVIAHEVAHNWFMGMLGSNETYRAFLDEGFTQFLSTWSLKKFNKIPPTFPIQMDERSLYNGYLTDALNQSDATLNTHSDDFSSALGHGGGYRHVYYKTATMLSNLQYVLGDSLFLEAMKHYVAKWKMRHPYPDDFRQAIIEHTQVDLNWFFDQWIETTKSIDYAIRRIKYDKKTQTHKIVLERKGEMQMPIDLAVYTKDKKVFMYHIPNTYFVKQTDAQILPLWRGWGNLHKTYVANIQVPGKISNVIIDSSRRMADINRLDNQKRGFNSLYWDKGIDKSLTFNAYPIGIRPDVWWNPVDGLKIGGHIKQGYAGKKHVMETAIWFNSGIFHDKDLRSRLSESQNATTLFSYVLDYSNLIAKNTYLKYHSRINDGISMEKIGVKTQKGDHHFDLTIKSFGSYLENSLFFHEIAIPGNLQYIHPFSGRNNTLNLNYTRSYTYFKGDGKWSIALRTPFLFTSYYYYRLQFESINTHRMGKSTLKTRLFASTLSAANGASLPFESQLMLGGANFEDLLDSKFTRTAGYIPGNIFWNGYQSSHFQMGGGLNLRGYTGYAAPFVNNTNQIEYTFVGNSGISGSAEFDIDDYFTFKPKWGKNIKSDVYIFGDAGVISPVQTPDLFKSGQAYPLRMDAGIGSCFTIKGPAKRNAIKPMKIRVDFPLFLNRPPAGQDFFAFRWLLGIARTF